MKAKRTDVNLIEIVKALRKIGAKYLFIEPVQRGYSVKLICGHCEKQFKLKASAVLRGYGKYCSKRCMAEAYKNILRGKNNPNYKGIMDNTFCLVCGVAVNNPYMNKYCSMRCYGETRKKTINKQTKLKLVSVIRYCPYCDIKITGSEQQRTCGSNDCQKKHVDKKRHERLINLGKKCVGCKKLFYSSPSANRKYCSYECFVKSGGTILAGNEAAKMTRLYGAKKDANHKEIVNAFEKMGAHVLDISNLGHGAPDLVVERERVLHLVDVKNLKTSYGKRGLNKIQKAWARNWQGGPVYLIHNIDEVEYFMKGEFDKIYCYGGYDLVNVESIA